MGHSVWINEGLETGQVWVAAEDKQCFVNEETWNTLRANAGSMRIFMLSFASGNPAYITASGLKFLDSANWWLEAVRDYAKVKGTDVINGKDRITQLVEDLEGLMIAAGGMADGTSSAEHLSQFFVRLALAKDELDAIETRVGHLRGLVVLAERAAATIH